MNKSLPKIFLILSYILNILLILLVFSNSEKGNYIVNFYNADHLFAHSFFNDIISNGNSVKGWYFPGAPGFFPDLTIYFFLYLIFGNPGVCQIAFSIIHVSLLLLFFNLLVKEIFLKINLLYLAFANVMLGMVYLITLTTYSIHSITFHLLAINYHTGAIVSTLLCLYLSFRFLRTNSTKILWLLMIIGCVSVLSDKLVVIFYVIPFSLSLILLYFKNKNRHQTIKLIVVQFIVVILGSLFYKLLKMFLLSFGSPSIKPSFKKALESFHSLFEVFSGFIQQKNTVTIVFLFMIITFAGMAIVIVKNIFISNRNIDDVRNNKIVNVYALYYSFLVPVSILVPCILGQFNSYVEIRYFEPVFYFGLLNFVVVIYLLVQHKKLETFVKYAVPGIALVFLLLVFRKQETMSIKNGIKSHINYYPGYVEFLDSVKTEYNLKNGNSGYWQSRVISMLSKKDIKVLTVYNSLFPDNILANKNWYYYDSGGKKAVFNFYFVAENFNKQNIYETFGDNLTELHYKNMALIIVPDFVYEEETGEIILLNN